MIITVGFTQIPQAMCLVPYQALVGSLNHSAVMTHPNILKAIQSVAQFLSNPGCKHWNATLQIVKYLNTTKDWILMFGGKSSDSIPKAIAYCNVDFANSQDHGHLISVYALMLNIGCFLWCSKKQTATATSTHELEYYSSVNSGHEILWICQLLLELHFKQPSSTPLHIKNTLFLHTLNAPDQVTNHTKHINVTYHWIKDEVQKQVIHPVFVPSDQNAADIFTKPFLTPCHKELCRMLGMGPQDGAY